MGLPLVVDGSGLNILVKHVDLVKGYARCVLTPNIAEFGRLAGAVGVKLEGGIGAAWQKHAQDLAAAFQGPLVLSKGPKDVLVTPAGDASSDKVTSVAVTEKGSLARAGGQGDVLAGMVGLFICWAHPGAAASSVTSVVSPGSHPTGDAVTPLVLAAAGASLVTRRASAAAYEVHGRGMVAGDLIPHLAAAVDHLSAEAAGEWVSE
jgi:ATP-dependent NAD(P)H-hydrate dehydratase